MNEKRCAWCGKRIELGHRGPTFCGHPCQRQYESWSRARTIARTEAVQRWRDPRAWGGDAMDGLLAMGASGRRAQAMVRLTEYTGER